MKRILAPLIGALLTAGCASTAISSVAAPEVASHGSHYSRILVYVALQDLSIRKQAEDRFVQDTPAPSQQYDSMGVKTTAASPYMFVASYTLIFPGRSYTNQEISSIMVENHIDGYLIVTNGESGVNTTTLPSSSTTDCTANSFGTQVNASCTTQQHGGGTYHKPWATFTANLHDVVTGQPVWYATSRTGGNAFASWGTVVESMADKTIEQMQKDQVIR